MSSRQRLATPPMPEVVEVGNHVSEECKPDPNQVVARYVAGGSDHHIHERRCREQEEAQNGNPCVCVRRLPPLRVNEPPEDDGTSGADEEQDDEDTTLTSTIQISGFVCAS